MTTSLVTGVVPSPADLPTHEVVEVVIAGAGLSGDVVDAIVAAEDEPVTEDRAESAPPTAPAADETTTTTTELIAAAEPPPTSPETTTPPTTIVASPPTTSPTTTTSSPTTTTLPPTTTTAPPTTTTTIPPTTTTTVPPTTTTTVPPTTTTTVPPTTTTTAPPTTTTTTAPPLSVQPDSASVRANGSVIIRVLANDSGQLDLSTLQVTTQPNAGAASLVGGSGKIRYEADPGSSGTDSFVYEVCTVDGACGRATVSLNVD